MEYGQLKGNANYHCAIGHPQYVMAVSKVWALELIHKRSSVLPVARLVWQAACSPGRRGTKGRMLESDGRLRAGAMGALRRWSMSLIFEYRVEIKDRGGCIFQGPKMLSWRASSSFLQAHLMMCTSPYLLSFQ